MQLKPSQCRPAYSASGLHARAVQRGVSLIELMIAITISLIILVALSYLFVNNSQSTKAVERANQQIENGRYAMQTLNDDLQMAGYWAEFSIGAAVQAGRIVPPPLPPPPAPQVQSLPDPCAGIPAAPSPQSPSPTESPSPSTQAQLNMLWAMSFAVQGYDQGAGLNCSTGNITDIAPNTDILVVRRVSGCVAGSTDCAVQTGAPYFQASSCNDSAELNSAYITDQYRLDTNTANLDRTQRDCTTAADKHQFLTYIYYVANNDQAGDGIPTLKRYEIGTGTAVSIAQGVQDMQIEYGIDTNGDGVPDKYDADPVNDSTSPSCGATTPCVSNFQNTMALQIYLLVRNPTSTTGYKDIKAYNLGLDAAGSAYVDGPYNDNYKRHVYSSTIRLINPSIRE